MTEENKIKVKITITGEIEVDELESYQDFTDEHNFIRDDVIGGFTKKLFKKLKKKRFWVSSKNKKHGTFLSQKQRKENE